MRDLLLFFTLLIAGTASLVITEPTLCCGWRSEYPRALSDSSHAPVRFHLQLQELGQREIEKIALEVSDPDSPRYGKFLSQAEIDRITAPDPSHVTAVSDWLSTQLPPSAQVSLRRGRFFSVECAAADAERLLATTVSAVFNPRTGQRAVRAASLHLPPQVEAAVAAVFGLHGLPLPPRPKGQSTTRPKGQSTTSDPAEPAAVTPTVIASQYGVSGVKVSRSDKNRQAVAEFQGQTMNHTDLQTFFSKLVPSFQSGDDAVSKFIGDAGDKHAEVEASLDVQYIMGMSPGIKTEFYLYDPMDFCGDLKNWTNTMLTDDDVPLVHSVSYGWQGNLSSIGCSEANVAAVDADFAKLAAKGISILFSSGDSGSGYSPSPQCSSKDLTSDMALEGEVLHSEQMLEALECCELAGRANVAGFTFTPGNSVEVETGACGGGMEAGVALTGTVVDVYRGMPNEQTCCELASLKGVGWTFTKGDQETHNSCEIFGVVNCTLSVKGTGTCPIKGMAISGRDTKRVEGTCQLFKTVTSNSSKAGSTSGGTSTGKVTLWPSWPASSPWVTAVGATRFVGQKAGNEEMATDQFGSGGGFSWQFGQTPDATWQSEDVANYLKVVPKDAPFPPAGSFPASGRATPDVSALGEGFQVYVSGQVEAVGGTSASCPLFAGLVSLLNEAKLQAGQPQMGFLNPWLYKNADAFTDVTKGTNAIGRGSGPVKYGFNCTAGWDPATGLGTPLFGKMLQAATTAK